MPIKNTGWELHIVRDSQQQRGSNKRTIGSYKVYHDGQAVSGLSGTMAESRGPGNNATAGNRRRVEAGRYPLWTQDGEKYKTYDYVGGVGYPRPGLELKNTGNRSEILIHPGVGFLASIGCINPCTKLPDGSENIGFKGSRDRTIALIEDLASYLGSSFPSKNGKKIPKAYVVIDGEP